MDRTWGRRGVVVLAASLGLLLMQARDANAAPLLPAPTTTTTTTAPPPAPVEEPMQADEAVARLLTLTNEARAAAGVGPLAARDDIADIAHAWSTQMAADGAVTHNDGYFTPETKQRLRAGAMAENVGRHVDIDRMHQLFMESAGHRANLLDARYAAVGFGAVFADGYWWVTEDFVQPKDEPRAVEVAVASAAPSAPAPVRAARAPRSRPVAATVTTEAARAAATTTTAAHDAGAVDVDEATLLTLPVSTDGSHRPTPLRSAATSPVAGAALVAFTLLALVISAHTTRLARRIGV